MLDMLDMLDWFGCYLIEFGCDWVLSTKGEPCHVVARWVAETTNPWHNRRFKQLLACA